MVYLHHINIWTRKKKILFLLPRIDFRTSSLMPFWLPIVVSCHSVCYFSLACICLLTSPQTFLSFQVILFTFCKHFTGFKRVFGCLKLFLHLLVTVQLLSDGMLFEHVSSHNYTFFLSFEGVCFVKLVPVLIVNWSLV